MLNTDNFPWIQLDDKQHAYQVVKFLPENPVIIEAGACDAEDTLKFKDIWPESTIHCFEPNTMLFDIASKNIANPPPQFSNSRNTKGINIYPLALSDTAGERTFFMSKAMAAASSFFEDNSKNVDVPQTVLDSLKITRDEYIPSYEDVEVKVKCVTIDGWRKENGIGDIDYIWLDTEGAELMILQGSDETLKNTKVVSIEFNFQEFRKNMAQFEDVYNFVASHGFDLYVIWQAHANWQANGIFVKKGLL
jgi:FkbM family methyltransferase